MKDNGTLRIGTRGSALAMWQAEWVRDGLARAHPDLRVEVVKIRTQGDRSLEASLSTIGGKGVFTKEIEDALLDGSVDVAVHSLKDLPTELPEGLEVGAVGEREDPRDALIARDGSGIGQLPVDPVIATGSLRRRAQLLHIRPDASIVDIRGNVGTRLNKYDNSDWSAIVLARAGLVRLGLESRITRTLTADEFLPAVGQGAVGVETRTGDEATLRRIEALDHEPTRLTTAAERSFLHHLGGGCQTPIGALGRVDGRRLVLDGLVVALDGSRCVRDRIEGDVENAEELGGELADRLLSAGARSIMESVHHG